MEQGRWAGGAGGFNAMAAQLKRQQEREEAFSESLAEDLGEDFRLPITHRPTENLNTDDMEQASVDTQLTSSNVGFRLLQKMGWKGKGLGKDEQGIVEPIKAGQREAKLGLGKQEEDDFFTSEENIHRKKLEVELEETEELARKREVEAEREQRIQSEVKEIRKVFFCDLCNKQYKLAMEFETHLSSYDHNHKKRFKEMKEQQQTSRNRDDRQKREQARQEKEMAARMAQLAEAQRQQQESTRQRQENAMENDRIPAASNSATQVRVQDQRTTLKFGFGTKPVVSKVSFGSGSKKNKMAPNVASVFRDDSDEET